VPAPALDTRAPDSHEEYNLWSTSEQHAPPRRAAIVISHALSIANVAPLSAASVINTELSTLIIGNDWAYLTLTSGNSDFRDAHVQLVIVRVGETPSIVAHEDLGPTTTTAVRNGSVCADGTTAPPSRMLVARWLSSGGSRRIAVFHWDGQHLIAAGTAVSPRSACAREP
jgi:hypothetical protein